MKQPSTLERTFATFWRQLGGPELTPEYRFAPPRRWRFDFAHPASRVAIELDGGTWTGGRHSRGAGYSGDCEKFNAAAALGWLVFRLTSDMLRDDPARHVEQIVSTIYRRSVNVYPSIGYPSNNPMCRCVVVDTALGRPVDHD